MNCDFTYAHQNSSICSYSVDNLDVTITGANLRNDTVYKVSLGKVACQISDSSETEIKCTLEKTIPAGKWLPKVTDEYGLVKLDETVTALEVSLVVTSISPKTGLNPAGGDLVTITGENFPVSDEDAYGLTISLENSVKCVVKTISSTEITCETEPIITSRRRLVSLVDFFMSFKSDSDPVVYEETGFELSADALKTVSLDPAKVSPITLRKIVIQLDDAYPEAGMTKEDFSVEIVPVSLEKTKLEVNNEGRRAFNVIAVDTVAKTITIKYGGAYSGTYDLLIKSKTNGNIDTSATPLKVVFEITGISPMSGSIFGGTVLTISGGPFSTDLSETIVKVGYKWWEGINHYCYVITVTETQVTCRLPLDLNRQAKEYEVIAYAATYEESNCELDNNCLYTFLSAASLPNVTGFTSGFDVGTKEY